MNGSVSAPMKPPTGTPVCRIPIAKPRSRSNHAKIARPPAGVDAAYAAPKTKMHATSHGYAGISVTANSAPVISRPDDSITVRSPQRSVSSPATPTNSAEPSISAVKMMPSCAFESAKVATNVGDSDPSACCTTDAPACAVVINIRTRQRAKAEQQAGDFGEGERLAQKPRGDERQDQRVR
jgi:hypothetical protein